MYLLRATTGLALWHVSLLYALALSGGICLAAFLLRVILPPWRIRLDGVILLAFLLLMAAMFIPQLVTTVPPPETIAGIDWPATLVFLALVACSLAGNALRNRLNHNIVKTA